ncbi:MAG: DUF4258 domain-containing protein [Bacteroidota bacterium]|nr:DUF4258 domain-containing protein [Bacteroidota bacterium]MDP4228611.1 DUF4258 domain-containing protein [Bacteroidota bacterium]
MTNVIFSQHALQQMFKRGISIGEIKYAVEKGEMIRHYPDDKPYPSKLFLVFIKKVPLHVIVAEKINDQKVELIIITAYRPDKLVWKEDFKTRR